MRVAFMGSDSIALPLLRYIKEQQPADIRLVSIFTQPDRRTGRGMRLQANPIKTWAIENDLEVLQPVKCGSEEADYLRREQIDLILVMAYGQILRRSLLEIPPVGIFNLHASLLPRLRGASPIHTAVALGLEETGISLMRIIPELDAGPVADSERVSIQPEDTVADVHGKLAQACVPLMARALPGLAQGSLPFTEQTASDVTYCRILEKTDSHLDFNRPASELANRVRAFQPWPGTSFPYEGTEVRILKALAELDDSRQFQPGTLLLEETEGLSIACGDGRLRVIELQRPGGKPLGTEAFLRGFKLSSGDVLESREMKPLEAPRAFPFKRK